MSKISITKFNVNNISIYVKLLWEHDEENLFQMHLYDGNHVWTGGFTKESAVKFKGKYENPDKYNEDIKNCLTGEDRSFSFKFVPEVSMAKFTCIKKFEGASQAMGIVTLHQDLSVDKLSFLDFLIDENLELRNSLTKLEESSNTVQKELKQYQNELENLIDYKVNMENSLYAKFIKLLNTKKKRIKLLENSLRNLGDCSHND